MFDYNDVPSIVKQIRDFPLIGGGFLSWPALTVTTAYNSAKVVGKFFNLESMKWGSDNIQDFNPNNPIHLRQARRGFSTSADFATSATMLKATGFVSGMMMPAVIGTAAVAAAKGVGMALEDDDQDRSLYSGNGKLSTSADLKRVKDAMSNLLPEYYRNTSRLIVDVNENGNIEWINTSRITNYGNMAEAANALLDPNVDSIADRSWNAVEILTGDYFRTGFGLQAFNELRANQTEFGQTIFKEGDNIIQDAGNMLNYIGKKIYINGSFQTVDNQLRAWSTDQEYNKLTGERINEVDSMMRLAGLRKIEFDPIKSLGSRAYELSQQNRTSSSTLNSELRSFDNLSDGDIRRAVLRKKNVFDETMQEAMGVIQSARDLGLTDEQIRSGFKGYISKKDVDKLMRGMAPVYSVKQLGESQEARTEIRGLDAGAKRNFSSNYERARQFGNSL
jgi:hypothetical protein